MGLKIYREDLTVDVAAVDRITWALQASEKAYVSFSGGKDSTALLHLVAMIARDLSKRVGCLIIDLEAQYAGTVEHMEAMVHEYADVLDLHWVQLPIKLRNAVSVLEPTWCAWDEDARDVWVRDRHPLAITNPADYPFFVPRMEFEEFMELWGVWYADGKTTAAFVGIRADESLNRFRTIASSTKARWAGHQWTTHVAEQLYNVYPLYDWRTEDIWRYHAAHPTHRHNPVYDRMHLAGLSIHQMRLCQPYGDDQRRGLWLYHILEPQTWSKIVARVSGVNSGALYVQEHGNIMGYGALTKPEGHTWESFCRLLLVTLPPPTRAHYEKRFRVFIDGWKKRGYTDGIPDEAPRVLENKHWAPSWRRLCKVLLRNDWWCKGLGLVQPKSDAYGRYMDMRKQRTESAA
jgi:predicted phosphoadenosine phosphosulfate sulfurtransferase